MAKQSTPTRPLIGLNMDFVPAGKMAGAEAVVGHGRGKRPRPHAFARVFRIDVVEENRQQAALFQRIYRDVLRPAGLLKPDLHDEDAAPHRFAQGMGAAVLLIATIALFAGAQALGWGLSFVVIALAAVNLFFGFCAGCFVYFQLQRLRR